MGSDNKTPDPTTSAVSPPEATGQATPAKELRRQIMDSRVPKNEREWWASREIERLQLELGDLAMRKPLFTERVYVPQLKAKIVQLEQELFEARREITSYALVNKYWCSPSPSFWRFLNNFLFFMLGAVIARLVWILLT